MIKNIVFSILIVSGFSSCDNNAIYDKNVSIKDRSWFHDQRPQFDVQVMDSTAKYNIYINLRHTNAYDYSNIYLSMREKGSKLKDTTYKKEIKLAEIDGKWLGKSAASLYEVEYLAKENYTFPDTGKYSFTLEQNMRDNPLKNIVDIGVKVIKK